MATAINNWMESKRATRTLTIHEASLVPRQPGNEASTHHAPDQVFYIAFLMELKAFRAKLTPKNERI